MLAAASHTGTTTAASDHLTCDPRAGPLACLALHGGSYPLNEALHVSTVSDRFDPLACSLSTHWPSVSCRHRQRNDGPRLDEGRSICRCEQHLVQMSRRRPQRSLFDGADRG